MWELIRTELHGKYLVTQVTPPIYEQCTLTTVAHAVGTAKDGALR